MKKRGRKKSVALNKTTRTLLVLFLILALIIIFSLLIGEPRRDVKLSPEIINIGGFDVIKAEFNKLTSEQQQTIINILEWDDEDYYMKGMEPKVSFLSDLSGKEYITGYSPIYIGPVPINSLVKVEFKHENDADYKENKGTLTIEDLRDRTFFWDTSDLNGNYDIKVTVFDPDKEHVYEIKKKIKVINDLQLSPGNDGGIDVYPPQGYDLPDEEPEEPPTAGDVPEDDPYKEDVPPAVGGSSGEGNDTNDAHPAVNETAPPVNDTNGSHPPVNDTNGLPTYADGTPVQPSVPSTVPSVPTPPPGEAKSKWCSCKKIEVRHSEGGSALLPFRVLPGVDKHFGEIIKENDAGDVIGLAYGFEIYAELEPESDPELCDEGQRVQETFITKSGMTIVPTTGGSVVVADPNPLAFKHNILGLYLLIEKLVSGSSFKGYGDKYFQDDDYHHPRDGADPQLVVNEEGKAIPIWQASESLQDSVGTIERPVKKHSGSSGSKNPSIVWYDCPGGPQDPDNDDHVISERDLRFVSYVIGKGTNSEGKKAKSCKVTFDVFEGIHDVTNVGSGELNVINTEVSESIDLPPISKSYPVSKGEGSYAGPSSSGASRPGGPYR